MTRDLHQQSFLWTPNDACGCTPPVVFSQSHGNFDAALPLAYEDHRRAVMGG
ncbi:hypothetical protein BCR43DRAFT_490936 [Syncephalastrum racemosum]|uniref:Uncharacterized protein n=1 Tax=Syncephalastrum racemosum TaxID=13706 RepID=A0A1X2HGS2_SYNRA|nr:hypothetical protein BCR43DRAFT_490936 [Syncephalastrum racemosum]